MPTETVTGRDGEEEQEGVPSPFIFVIFGASGDLTRRKLVPALWSLYCEGRLPQKFAIVGVARTAWTDAEFRATLRQGIREHSRYNGKADAEMEQFLHRVSYHRMQYDETGAYRDLAEYLEWLSGECGTPRNYLFYLSLPTAAYPAIVRNLCSSGLARESERGWRRLVAERPFGSDLDSARELNTALREGFRERQVYRIDHHLGNETVQSLLIFRFANGIFEPIWDNRYVDHVQITAAESGDPAAGGGDYEQVGELREMVQNHLLQVLGFVAMESPAQRISREIRNEQVKVLDAIRPFTPEQIPLSVVRAQYTSGTLDGQDVPGYLHEPNVSPRSRAETYVALKVRVDNWRWAGVPFYIRSGKRLAQRVTEVAIHFKKAPHLLFRGIGDLAPERNVLKFRLYPDHRVGLEFSVKVPGAGMHIRPVSMEFTAEHAPGVLPPDDYESLLLDALRGQATLFTRDDWQDLSWTLMDPILQAWKEDDSPLPQYRAGTWGPKDADALLERDGRAWQKPG